MNEYLLSFDLHRPVPRDYGVLERLLGEIFENIIDLEEGSTFRLRTEIGTSREVLKKIMWRMLEENLRWDADLIVTKMERGEEANGNTQIFRMQIDAGMESRNP